MNDKDREDWVNNDEGLYDWRIRSRLSMRNFLKQNRKEIDAAINKVLSGTKRTHFLKYG
jgi:hypothetical protein